MFTNKTNPYYHLQSFVIIPLLVAATVSSAQADPQSAPRVSVLATGLNNPRGLKFGPGQELYVAEGGIGGNHSAVGQCDQVPGVGPYTGSDTGSRISRISKAGERTTVADNLLQPKDSGRLAKSI